MILEHLDMTKKDLADLDVKRGIDYAYTLNGKVLTVMANSSVALQVKDVFSRYSLDATFIEYPLAV